MRFGFSDTLITWRGNQDESIFSRKSYIYIWLVSKLQLSVFTRGGAGKMLTGENMCRGRPAGLPVILLVWVNLTSAIWSGFGGSTRWRGEGEGCPRVWPVISDLFIAVTHSWATGVCRATRDQRRAARGPGLFTASRETVSFILVFGQRLISSVVNYTFQLVSQRSSCFYPLAPKCQAGFLTTNSNFLL